MFGLDANRITLVLDDIIELCYQYKYFEGHNDENIGGIMTGARDSINNGVSWCVAGGWAPVLVEIKM